MCAKVLQFWWSSRRDPTTRGSFRRPRDAMIQDPLGGHESVHKMEGSGWQLLIIKADFKVTKLLKVLHMIDLQFFPLVSTLKTGGGEAAFLCLHRHHHYTINYKLFFTGGFFFSSKFMKLMKIFEMKTHSSLSN